MDPFVLRATRRLDQCAVHGCRSVVTPGTSNGVFCRRCRDRRYKARHPYTYTLNKLRNNARRRGIEFNLTLEEFTMFCDLTGYMSAHGRFADDLSIDRENNKRGYVLDNIRAITVAENRRKQAVDMKLDRLRVIQAAIDRALQRHP